MSMAIGGPGSAGPMDRETFGAAVVSETLDRMNGMGGRSGPAPVDRESAEASLVSKTFDYMNSGSSGSDAGMSQSYDFQTSVLGAYATGALVNTMI